jgi:hypothetical protein
MVPAVGSHRIPQGWQATELQPFLVRRLWRNFPSSWLMETDPIRAIPYHYI